MEALCCRPPPKEKREYRAAVSMVRFPVEEGQGLGVERGIEVRQIRHAERASGKTEFALRLVAIDADQNGNRHSRLGDDHILAVAGTFEELGEVGLGIVNISRHGVIVADLVRTRLESGWTMGSKKSPINL